ncbi:unnamed protein product [Mycena citricolor]|uniref:Uncharacterized protein n=1 Tax=Mycena citricolor TaxID=2018698 RepID=A0AAD2Q505_9AGAR|nr:unnamed protein product [Mycena citricolor]
MILASLILLAMIEFDAGLQNGRDPKHTLLTTSSYLAALFTSLSALSSFALLDRIGDIEFAAASRGLSREGLFPNCESSHRLLRLSGATRSFTILLAQFVVYSFLAAMFFLTEMVTYLWLKERTTLSIIITAVSMPAALLLLVTSLVVE